MYRLQKHSISLSKTKTTHLPKTTPRSLKKHAPDAEGITLTGGEPFDQIDGCSALLKAAQQMGLSTVVYTGYSLEYLKKSQNPLFKQALEYIDILIDGPYKKEMSGRYLWRGSSNQRIILLSDRYSKDDLTIIQHVDEEVFIYNNNKEQGTIVQTGIVKTTIF